MVDIFNFDDLIVREEVENILWPEMMGMIAINAVIKSAIIFTEKFGVMAVDAKNQMSARSKRLTKIS